MSDLPTMPANILTFKPRRVRYQLGWTPEEYEHRIATERAETMRRERDYILLHHKHRTMRRVRVQGNASQGTPVTLVTSEAYWPIVRPAAFRDVVIGWAYAPDRDYLDNDDGVMWWMVVR